MIQLALIVGRLWTDIVSFYSVVHMCIDGEEIQTPPKMDLHPTLSQQ
jgi:hypothetical protein